MEGCSKRWKKAEIIYNETARKQLLAILTVHICTLTMNYIK